MSASSKFRVRFWGVRGSIPSPGPTTAKYGGNTSCVEMRCGDTTLIFDCGTGARMLGEELLRAPPVKAHLFFSHVHWDHIQGFPFFRPCFVPGNDLTLYGGKKGAHSLEEVLAGQMNYPNFPVSLAAMDATLRYVNVEPGVPLHLDDVSITSYPLTHPNGCLGYRVEYDGKVVVYATDNELDAGPFTKAVRAMVADADVLIADSQYTLDEYHGRNSEHPKKGWGHSTWNAALELAKQGSVEKCILYHHDYSHDDDFLDELERVCQGEFPGAVMAYEGLVLELP